MCNTRIINQWSHIHSGYRFRYRRYSDGEVVTTMTITGGEVIIHVKKK